MILRSSFGYTSVALLAALSIGACKKSDWSPVSNASQHGRYLGVGIYGPGKPWTRLVADQKPKSDSVAQPIDDQAIIVVTDSTTGEVRACGDLSGACVGMNPWRANLANGQLSPVRLTGHEKAVELDDAAANAAAAAVERSARR